MSDECPGCGAPAPAVGHFCPRCGQPLGAAAAPPVVPAPPPVATRRPQARAVPRRAAQRRDPIPSPWRAFVPALQLWIWLLVLIGVLGLTGRIVDVTSPWVDVAATSASCAIVGAYAFRDRKGLVPLLRRSGFDEHTWWHPLVALVGLPTFLHLYFWGLAGLGAEMQRYSDDVVAHGWPIWTAFVLVSILPAVFEEIGFRGFIMRRLDAVMGPREAIAVQGAMFAVLHLSPIIFPSHFVLGAALGVLRRSTGSLYPGIAIHALWNAWVLVQELYPL